MNVILSAERREESLGSDDFKGLTIEILRGAEGSERGRGAQDDMIKGWSLNLRVDELRSWDRVLRSEFEAAGVWHSYKFT